MASSKVVCITVARLARSQRIKRCTAAQFHEVMARQGVQITFTSGGLFIKRDGCVIAALVYGAREPYLIDSAA